MIDVGGLSKGYGDRIVLDQLSFTVPDHSVSVLLGPNGAGKSSLLAILAGCLAPEGGTVVLSPGMLGYMPEVPPLYDDLSVREYLLFCAGWKGLASDVIPGELDRVLELFRLDEVKGRRLGVLSKGFRQRCGLAQCDLGQPPVLLLDEPTAGLDPLQIKETRDWILSVKKRSSVLVSTHILEEAAEIGDQVLILHGGKVHPCGSALEEIRERFFGIYGKDFTV